MNTYIGFMPRSAPSSAISDLVDHMPSTPQHARKVLPKVVAPLSDISSLSDARLARVFVEATTEVQRPKGGKAGHQSRPELDQAIQVAAGILEAMIPKRNIRAKRTTRAGAGPSLQDGKRKAIRTALQAGVAPGQGAKHFGLPLAAVRKVLAGET